MLKKLLVVILIFTNCAIPQTKIKVQSVTTQRINDTRFADQFTNIQAAITDAGTTGAVIIPTSYTGSDSYTNPNGIAVIDLRGLNNGLRLWSGIETSFPTTNFPEGNDLFVRTRGPADLYLEKLKTATVATTSMGIGANPSVTVGAVTVGNTTRGALQTGTTALFSTSAPITIGRETANEELVNPGSWTIVDSTHISATTTKTHTQPYDVEQMGTVFLSAGDIVINSFYVKPSLATTAPMRVRDSQLNNILFLPTNLADAWPNSGIPIAAFVTGGNGANKDLLFRNNLSSSLTRFNNAANSANMITIAESGGGPVVTFTNPTNQPYKIDASTTDLPRLTMGGTVAGAIFYGNIGAGTSGIFRFRNNPVDDSQKVTIDTAQGNINTVGQVQAGTLTVGGGTTISAVNIFTASLTPALVAASSFSEQSFTFTGVNASDKCSILDRPVQAGSAAPTTAHVTGANTVSISYVNPTAGGLTPPAGSYSLLCAR